MFRVIENFTCGVLRTIMGRRSYHFFATHFYKLRSSLGVKALGVLLITIFCIFMYGPNLKVREPKIQGFSLLRVQAEIAANPANIDSKLCGAYDLRECALVKLHLRYVGDSYFKERKWKLYFSMIRRVLTIQTHEFLWVHVNGDLNFIEPSDSFEGFTPGEDYVIPLLIGMCMISYGDLMPNFYVVEESGKITIIENTKNKIDYGFGLEGSNLKRKGDDHSEIMNPMARYQRNEKTPLKMLDRESYEGRILPTPKSSRELKGRADLSKGVAIVGEGWELLSIARQASVVSRFEIFGIKVFGSPKMSTSGAYVIKINKPLLRWKAGDIDPYDLKIEPNGAVLSGSKSGIYYGLQTFLSLVSLDLNSIPCLDISDSARFKHRGFMLDVARHFQTKSTIFRLLDQMAAIKLNTFHFHLSDNEGWRLDIPGLPELAKHGSQRCHNTDQCLIPQLGSGPYTDNLGSGFYSVKDYKDILRYASARNIKVLPEFDMPGHSRAAVMAMEHRFKKYQHVEERAKEYRLLDPDDSTVTLSVQFFDRTSAMNPCLGSTYKFIGKVVSEVKKMYEEVGLPLDDFMVGGDETKSISHFPPFWAGSLVCKRKGLKQQDLLDHFLHNVNKVFVNLGIRKLYAWSDIVGKNPTKGVKSFHETGTTLYLDLWDPLEWGALKRFEVLASAGLKLINNMPDFLYFDMPQEANPYEKGYYWATRFTDLKKVFSFNPVCIAQNSEIVLDHLGSGIRDQYLDDWPTPSGKSFHWHGIQANLWGETIHTEDDLFFMVFPRLFALAEKAWHKGPWEVDSENCAKKAFGMKQDMGKTFTKFDVLDREYEVFVNLVMQREYPKLDAAGVSYRVPPPGYMVKGGVLEANVEFPGFLLQASVDGGKNWFFYDEKDKPKISDISQLRMRAVTHNGKQFSRNKEEALGTAAEE